MKKELRNRIQPSKVLAVCLLTSMSACTMHGLGLTGSDQYVTVEGTPEGMNAFSDMLTGVIIQSKRQHAQGDDAHYELRRSQERYRGISYYGNRIGSKTSNNRTQSK